MDDMAVCRPDVPHGVCPVLETPFDFDGGIDLPGFDRVLDAMITAGAAWVMYPGFASEFHKLADNERRTLTHRLLQRAGHQGVRVVASVADHATRLAVDAARSAVDHGAAAINLLPPYVLDPTPAAVVDHVGAVLDSVAPVPVIVQYAPALTGGALGPAAWSGLAEQHPNLMAVKVEAQPPGPVLSALAASRPPLGGIVGYGGLHLPDALRRGAIAVQPGCSFVELYLALWRRWSCGDHAGAEALYQRMLPYLAYWMQQVELIIAAEKAISAARGWFVSSHCRAPAWSLDTVERERIERFLREFADELT